MSGRGLFSWLFRRSLSGDKACAVPKLITVPGSLSRVGCEELRCFVGVRTQLLNAHKAAVAMDKVHPVDRHGAKPPTTPGQWPMAAQAYYKKT